MWIHPSNSIHVCVMRRAVIQPICAETAILEFKMIDGTIWINIWLFMASLYDRDKVWYVWADYLSSYPLYQIRYVYNIQGCEREVVLMWSSIATITWRHSVEHNTQMEQRL